MIELSRLERCCDTDARSDGRLELAKKHDLAVIRVMEEHRAQIQAQVARNASGRP